MPDHFNEQLCDCTKDLGVCLFAIFVPLGMFCIQAKAVELVKKEGIVVPCLLGSCLGCIGGAINRSIIRHALDIKGNLITDCLVWTCFPQCASCQEYREVKKRQENYMNFQ